MDNYEKMVAFREMSDESLETLKRLAEDGASASEMLKEVELLKTYLEIVVELEDE